ncbi:MAG: hypothetical protein ACOC23_03880 [Thermodesulfobacteriota bacterium]
MEPIYLAAGASFILGASGYIIIQFWIRPIRRYRALKRRIVSDIECDGRVSSKPKAMTSSQAGKAFAKTLRSHSVALSDAYSYDLPHWYRMVLDNRGESPIEASKILMRMANTQDPIQIRERRKEICESLGA